MSNVEQLPMEMTEVDLGRCEGGADLSAGRSGFGRLRLSGPQYPQEGRVFTKRSDFAAASVNAGGVYDICNARYGSDEGCNDD